MVKTSRLKRIPGGPGFNRPLTTDGSDEHRCWDLNRGVLKTKFAKEGKGRMFSFVFFALNRLGMVELFFSAHARSLAVMIV